MWQLKDCKFLNNNQSLGSIWPLAYKLLVVKPCLFVTRCRCSWRSAQWLSIFACPMILFAMANNIFVENQLLKILLFQVFWFVYNLLRKKLPRQLITATLCTLHNSPLLSRLRNSEKIHYTTLLNNFQK